MVVKSDKFYYLKCLFDQQPVKFVSIGKTKLWIKVERIPFCFHRREQKYRQKALKDHTFHYTFKLARVSGVARVKMF